MMSLGGRGTSMPSDPTTGTSPAFPIPPGSNPTTSCGEADTGSAGSGETEKRVSEEGVTGLPQGQPGAGVGRTQKTFLPTGLFPEFDFSVEVLPNFNSTKKEEHLSPTYQ